MDIRDLRFLVKNAKISYGGFSARGLPAIIVSLSGLVLAGGIARAIACSASSLPETFREGRSMLDSAQSKKGTFTPEVVRAAR